jgi:hypothetical protein
MRSALTRGGERGPTVAAIFPGGADAHLLTLRGHVDATEVGLTSAPALRCLDVTILHEIILERLLGIDRAAQEAQQNLVYLKDTKTALTRIAAGEGQVCFLMNATPVAQIRACAEAGEVMPQKSTFFYPKIASGVVFRAISPLGDVSE